MKKLQEKNLRESAEWEYKGYQLEKLDGYWYARKDNQLYVGGCEPNDTMEELKMYIDLDSLEIW